MKYEITNNNKMIDFVSELIQKVEPNLKNIRTQNQVVQKITENIWNTIDKNNIRDKIYDVSLQGSFAKATDLPTSGSDLDIFVIFKDDFDPDLGLELGMQTLKEYNPRSVQAKVKFAESEFEQEGLEIKVQIVPIKYKSLIEIATKTDAQGNPIKEIGMERTPHQTNFMIENLTDLITQVKILKQFMKDIGVYDSSIVSQGFSGYMAECLIYNLKSFIDVVRFFANFVKGSTVGKLNADKIYNSKFNLADPIDPNRNLINDTVSDIKLARMILVCRHLLANSKIPEQKTIGLQSIEISFKSNEYEKERQGSQLNSAIKTISNLLKTMGYNTANDVYMITDNYRVDYPYIAINTTKDNEVTFILGVNNTVTPSEKVKSRISLKKGLSDMTIQVFKNLNKNYKCEENEDEIIVWIDNEYSTIEKALEKILITDIQESGLPDGVKIDIGHGVKYKIIENFTHKCLV
jgi:tRNA nucleotidyltransferase (CCA-adding enzyme)